MSSAAFILAINFCVAGIFAIIFAFIAGYDQAYRSARWFSLAYVLGMASTFFEFILPMLPEGRFFVVVGIFTSFLLALIAGVVGISQRYNIKPPKILLLVILCAGVAANVYIYDLPRDSAVRLFLYQGPYFATQLVGAFIVASHAGQRRLDKAVAGVLFLSAMNYLAKPFFAWMVGGPGATPEAYINTAYALYSQTMGAVIAVALGALFMAVYVQDMLTDIRQESETDRLSGLLNRRGFEQRVKRWLECDRADSKAASLVLCDLDHFKMVNDEFGHEAGDRVIEAFANLLRTFSSTSFALGRIGGEEFAIFLPAANRPVARLFAASVRSAFANATIKDLPPRLRFTASFGVAEVLPGEDYASLLRRADKALYDAKRDGRNRVCMAEIPPMSSPVSGERRTFRST